MNKKQIKVLSLNVRSMRDYNKRKIMYKYFRDHNADIIMLQETHITNDVAKRWKTEWGGQWYNSFGESNARGVSILMNKKFEHQIINNKKDENGRLIMCQFRHDQEKYTLLNVYGPNDENVTFIQQIKQWVKNIEGQIIIGGDWNIILDPEIDSQGRNITHVQAREELKNLLENDFYDVWRCHNPDIRKLTWYKLNPRPIFSRLDFFLINTNAMNSTETCSIIPGMKTDHSAITINLNVDNFERGPGIWKLNLEHLSNSEYIETIKETIANSARLNAHLTPIEMWEQMKYDIRLASQKFSQHHAHKNKCKINNLNKSLQYLNEALTQDPSNKEIKTAINEINECKTQLYTTQIKGTVFRSKANWVANGEKNTKYFLNLEKHNYYCRNMKIIQTESGQIIKQQNQILKEQRNYYQTLFKKDESVKFTLQPLENERLLSADEKNDLEKDLTEDELFAALKNMNNKKTPGLDGLSKEFYIIFWRDLKQYIVSLYDTCFTQKQLNWSARRGLITLLPKKEKNIQKLSSWRPPNLTQFGL